jgi:hypothetical protein
MAGIRNACTILVEKLKGNSVDDLSIMGGYIKMVLKKSVGRADFIWLRTGSSEEVFANTVMTGTNDSGSDSSKTIS